MAPPLCLHLGFDHALNTAGIDQAQDLNRAWRSPDPSSLCTAELGFTTATHVFSSPLTRAVQTAAVACQGHPALASKGGKLTLSRFLRERKNTQVSLDTVGAATGTAILERATKGLNDAKFSKEGLKAEDLMPAVDASDCGEDWWSSVSSYDSDAEIHRRIRCLWDVLKYHPAKAAILVGHSLFFRELVRISLSEAFCSAPGSESFASDLHAYKICNAGVLYIEVEFPVSGGATITDAKLIFGSTFAGKDESDE